MNIIRRVSHIARRGFRAILADPERGNATFVALLSGLAIFIMALVRLHSGQTDRAITNFIAAGGLALCLVWLWRTRTPSIPLNLSGLLSNSASAWITYKFGSDVVSWVVLTQVCGFYLVSARNALIYGLIPIVVLGLSDEVFNSNIARGSFVLTSSLILLFSFIAARRSEIQRALLKTQATHDPLTNAGNRRLMEQSLESATAQQDRGNSTFGLCVIDIDFFKQINDQFGHAAGDTVLIGLVQLLKKNLRGPDRVFRIGGEEFAVLFFDTDAQMLKPIVERLHQQVSGRLHGPGGPVFVSIGGASMHVNETANECLRRADAALYKAKGGGRNQVVLA